jgi:hypothetical protein
MREETRSVGREREREMERFSGKKIEERERYIPQEIYWLVASNEDAFRCEILRFDLAKEKFKIVPSPP